MKRPNKWYYKNKTRSITWRLFSIYMLMIILTLLANSAFGVANAFTRYGQTLSDDNWVKFDEIGGKMANITQKRWETTVQRAATLGDKELEKVFGSVAA